MGKDQVVGGRVSKFESGKRRENVVSLSGGKGKEVVCEAHEHTNCVGLDVSQRVGPSFSKSDFGSSSGFQALAQDNLKSSSFPSLYSEDGVPGSKFPESSLLLPVVVHGGFVLLIMSTRLK